MLQEEGQPWMDMTIDACEPPHRLALSAANEHGGWHMDMLLTETGGVTELRFTHHLSDTDGVGEIGPGWEYYLDALVASRDGQPDEDRVERTRFEVHLGDQVVAVAPPGRVGGQCQQDLDRLRRWGRRQTRNR